MTSASTNLKYEAVAFIDGRTIYHFMWDLFLKKFKFALYNQSGFKIVFIKCSCQCTEMYF